VQAEACSRMVSPASLRPVGTGFTGPTAPDINTPSHVFHAGSLRRGYSTGGLGTRGMKEEGRGLLNPTFQGGEILVYSAVEGFERFLRQPLFVPVIAFR
jgi:hypothetical protein